MYIVIAVLCWRIGDAGHLWFSGFFAALGLIAAVHVGPRWLDPARRVLGLPHDSG